MKLTGYLHHKAADSNATEYMQKTHIVI